MCEDEGLDFFSGFMSERTGERKKTFALHSHHCQQRGTVKNKETYNQLGSGLHAPETPAWFQFEVCLPADRLGFSCVL